MTEINEKTFIGLENLQDLNVSYNQLTEIKENSFSGLNNLRELALVGNQFTEIKKKHLLDLIICKSCIWLAIN